MKTDQAWQLLYSRLEQDGLLAETNSGKPANRFRLRTVKWAAAIAILCLSITTALILSRSTNVDNSPLLTVQNGSNAATLVTTLEDGSIVYLADNTELQFPEHFSPDKREVSLQGNALFDVSGNRKRPFLIETGLIQIEVIGTAFNVKSTRNAAFELSVQHGEVKVTLKQNGQTIRVKAGETVTLLSQRLQVDKTNDETQFMRYTQRIQFKDERLADILRVINRDTEGLQLKTTTPLEDRRLTVTFSNDSPDTMAELICLALNLKYTQENDVLLISESQ